MRTWMLKSWVAATLSAVAVAAQGGLVSGTLYDNTENQVNNDYVMGFTNTQTVGDQIFLDNYLTLPYLTSFSLEYFSPDTHFSGTVQADVSFYLNDGSPFNGYNAPGTLFYDTGFFNIQAPNTIFPGTNSAVLTFNTSDLYSGADTPLPLDWQMPSNFTVVVSFKGLGSFDQVGLNDFEPPTIGTNYGDYWLDDQGSWELLTNASTPFGFAMQLTGQSQPTPEPTTVCLVAAGAALIAGFAARRRRQ